MNDGTKLLYVRTQSEPPHRNPSEGVEYDWSDDTWVDFACSKANKTPKSRPDTVRSEYLKLGTKKLMDGRYILTFNETLGKGELATSLFQWDAAPESTLLVFTKELSTKTKAKIISNTSLTSLITCG